MPRGAARSRDSLQHGGQHWKSQQPPNAPAGSQAAGRELAELWAAPCSLSPGILGQEGEPQRTATTRAEGRAAVGRWLCALFAQVPSAQRCSLPTPPVAARKTPTPRWSCFPLLAARCRAPSAGSASLQQRWRGTAAPVGSEGPPPSSPSAMICRERLSPTALWGRDRAFSGLWCSSHQPHVV